MSLSHKIKTKKAKVGVIGLGYVGLPNALEIAKAGFSVFGIDIRKEKIRKLNKGISYINFVKNSEIKNVLKSGHFKAFNNFEPLKFTDVVIICVPTPLDKNKVPNISFIKNSAIEIKKRIHKDELILLESTTYPGTTEEVLLPLFEENHFKAGKDFYLAFCPERIDPGNKMPFSEVPRVVGGITKQCTKVAEMFYKQFIKKVYPVSSAKVAEMTKLLENIYRLINISAINELALLCSKMGIDIWEVIEAAKTKPYGFHPFYPSPKCGGHCIPLDPFYLSWKAKEYRFWTRFIDLAGEINEQMPHFIVTRINYLLNLNKKPIKGSKILVWGVAYKRDVADARESSAYDIIYDLLRKGAKVDYFDPYIKKFEISNPQLKKPIILKSVKYSPEIFKKYDLVLILTDHSGFDYEKFPEKSKIIFDTRNAIKSRKHKNVSWL